MIPHLLDLPHFTLWATRPNPVPGKKPLKVPLHLDGTTHHSLADPAMPLDWHTALACAEFTGARLGFRPHTSTKVCCIDLDNCIDEHHNWSEHAQIVEAMLPGAAIEESVSQRGLHFWFSYTGPGWGKRGRKGTPLGDIDLFSSADAFVAFGTYLRGDASVDLTVECQAIVDLCFPSAAGPSKMSPEWEIKSPDEKARSVADLRSALAAMPSDDRREWVAVGECLVELGDTGWELWNEWSAKSEKYNEGDAAYRWSGFSGDRAGYAGVFRKAERYGWANRRGVDPVAAFQPVAALPNGASTVPPPPGSLSFMAAAEGAIKATPANVTSALLSNESSVCIAYDNFAGDIIIGGLGKWRKFLDADYMMLRVEMEKRGFASIPPEIIKSAVHYVASMKAVDTAIEWAQGLVWDGIPRVSLAMTTYFGCEENDYSRSVAEYLFTALAGRCLSPGCQADMAIILVGLQGARKTSVVSALCPTQEAFAEIDLEKKDDVLSRAMRGKLVAEISEMKGLSGRALESTKAFISRRIERWIPKYKEFECTYARRLVMIGTANDRELLDDPTGERRWLPIICGNTNPEALQRDCQQLWAEAIIKWRAHGIFWRDAEKLARSEHHKFKIDDEIENRVVVWLELPAREGADTTNGEGSFSLSTLMAFLGFSAERADLKNQKRIAKILRKLGYEKFGKREGKQVLKMWSKK